MNTAPTRSTPKRSSNRSGASRSGASRSGASRSGASRSGAKRSGARRSTPVGAIVAVVLVAVVALGVAVAVAGGSGGTSSETSSGTALTFGTPTVTGAALTPYSTPTGDSSVGRPAPVVAGQDFDGGSAALGGTSSGGRPTVIAFLAHWCPHCQRELPVLSEVLADGGFGDARAVAVVTGTKPQATNFPPAAWLDREGWTGDVLVDDEQSSIGAAYGLSSFPLLVVLDADGNVAARASGELSPAALEALVAQAR